MKGYGGMHARTCTLTQTLHVMYIVRKGFPRLSAPSPVLYPKHSTAQLSTGGKSYGFRVKISGYHQNSNFY